MLSKTRQNTSEKKKEKEKERNVYTYIYFFFFFLQSKIKITVYVCWQNKCEVNHVLNSKSCPSRKYYNFYFNDDNVFVYLASLIVFNELMSSLKMAS